MIHVVQAGGKFSASRPRGSHHHNRFFCFNIRIGTIAFIADNQVHIHGVTLGSTVCIDLDAVSLQLVFKGACLGLILVAGNYHGRYFQSPALEFVNGS